MQVVVGDDIDGLTFNYVQLHSIMFRYIHFCSITINSIQLHAVPFSPVQFIQLTTQLETVKLSELMEGTYLPCGR